MTDDSHRDASVRDPAALLAAWREQGADRLDPVRFRFIEAMARCAAVRHGHARRVLDEKLEKLLQAYRKELEARRMPAGDEPGDAGGAAAPAAACHGAGPLAELAGYIATRKREARTDDRAAGDADGGQGAAVYPELPLLDYFRDTWSRYSARRQLKHSEERVPENAGPLNSSLLVHRTLSLMREVSPEYLHRFLSYVDALSWMEQATRVDLVADKDGARGAATRKAPRGASR